MSYLKSKLPESDVDNALFAKEPWRRTLWAAADIIVEQGWCQNTAKNAIGNVCMGGAISMAHHGSAYGWAEAKDALARMRNTLKAEEPALSISGCAVSEWNNQPGRTAEEVIAKLREVALA